MDVFVMYLCVERRRRVCRRLEITQPVTDLLSFYQRHASRICENSRHWLRNAEQINDFYEILDRVVRLENKEEKKDGDKIIDKLYRSKYLSIVGDSNCSRNRIFIRFKLR